MKQKPITVKVHPQIKITVFPKNVGQPAIDVICLTLTQVEGKVTNIFMTPDEAIEIGCAMISAVNVYLYNQKQYQEDIIEPRVENYKNRKKKHKVKKGRYDYGNA